MDKRIENLLAALKDLEGCTLEDRDGYWFNWSNARCIYHNTKVGPVVELWARIHTRYKSVPLQGLKIVEDSDEH